VDHAEDSFVVKIWGARVRNRLGAVGEAAGGGIVGLAEKGGDVYGAGFPLS
jgi:hypothetical protein